MSATKRIRFNEAISCMDGSFASGEVKDIATPLADAWLKSGQATLAPKDPVSPDTTDVVKTPFTPRDTPKPKKVVAPKVEKPKVKGEEKKLKFS